LKNLRRYGIGARVCVGAVALLAPVLVTSCGGPYTARRVSLPNEKIAIADLLFQRGKYADAAIEYKDFLATFAGDERSDYAQFRVAESYRMDEDYALAAVEYRILINDFGYSEYIDDAFFLEGLCAFEQSPRSERDQTKTYEAFARIARFLELFPDSPRRSEAEKVLAQIHDRLGEKVYNAAKLYYSKERFSAAMIYYDKIILLYPETVWAGKSHYYRGVILEERGESDGAIREYGKAVDSRFEFDEKQDAAARLGNLTGGDSGGA
jgi:outer membrane protein assembly factor BamD